MDKTDKMDRRKFSTLLAMTGAGAASARAFASAAAPETLQLRRNGWMPNNEAFPVLLYHGAFPASGNMASAMETVF